MSSDGKEPGSVWQGPIENNWDQQFDQPQHIDHEELPPPPDPQGSGSIHLSNLIEEPGPSATDDTNAQASSPSLTMFDQFKQLSQYVSLILLPLLFGGLTALIVLPFVASGRAIVPQEGLWPIAIAILIIILAQGLAVYYSGDNIGLKVISTLGGLYLFLLVAVFALFGVLSGTLLLILLIALTVLMARLYAHPVPEGYVDVVYSLGKYKRTLRRGLNILLPWEKIAKELSIEEMQWVCALQRVQLSREEDVLLRGMISYQIMPEYAYLAVTQISDWQRGLHELFVTAIQSIATTFTPEDFMAWPQGFHTVPTISRGLNALSEGSGRWQQVNNYLHLQIRDKATQWGIQVNWITIRDVSIVPHGSVLPEIDPAATTQPGNIKIPTAPQSANGDKSASTPPKGETAPLPNSSQSVNPAIPVAAKGNFKVSEKALKDAYKAVQNNSVTDPITIRTLADRFDEIANNPELSQKFDFDAARAAINLRNQAKKYEDLHDAEISTLFNDETRPDWVKQQSGDKKTAGS